MCQRNTADTAAVNGHAEATSPKPAEEPLEEGSAEWQLHLPVSTVDPKDQGTPDDWIPRHPELIRLTGRHPFNCEPPPNRLMESFITPPSLHYVRDHAKVPKLTWEGHRIVVNGLVDTPRTLSMADILRMPTVDVTCTLTCAGNRRKEQNMVKQTIGFGWGPSGTSCSTWTGVRLGDVLRACGVQGDDAQYVCMRGPKGELPKGDDGSYGSSITLHRAMDPSYDVILAYKQNGRLLTPDHGFPIRVIIPGFIGGRMIKWIEEITVTAEESKNYYHFHDNRILPSHVDAETATRDGWWMKPEYIFNHLNINSAVTSPGHDDALSPTDAGCTFRGYAYSNGNKVTRCELTLDDGVSWRLADITHRAAPNAAGRHWAWVWWEIWVPFGDLLDCREVACRAWDETNNTQPNTFTWNVMGMGNNCIYRVKVHPRPTADARFALQFEHPTLAGAAVGGWMNRADKSAAVAVEAKAAEPAAVLASSDARRYSMEEVERHDSRESAWFVYAGKVYDATPFLADHPGGADSILLVAGTDATDEFDAIHSAKAKAMLLKYYIGEVAAEGATASAAATPPAPLIADGHTANGASPPVAPLPLPPPAGAAADLDLVALNPKKRIAFALAEKHVLSPNVRRFRFALQSPRHRMGMPVGKHVFLYAKIEGELVMRAYTPSSSDDDLGHFDLVIKVYRANDHPSFPGGGKMSQHLDSLAIGDTIEAKGPVGHVQYLGRGVYTVDGQERYARRINMVAGGTGITPCYQIVQALLKDAGDETEVSLLYCNQTPEDILLKEELDQLAKAHANFDIWYTVSRVGEGSWPFSVGRIDETMMREHLHPAAADIVCCMCGPPGMEAACMVNLKAMGFAEQQMIKF